MITSRQIRAARALLGWTQQMLADRATVSLTALKRMEATAGLRVFESTSDQVRRALEAEGIAFVNAKNNEGVMIVREQQPENHRSF